MKKTLCLLLSLVMIFGVSVSVSAVDIIVNPGYHATYDEASLNQAIPANPTAKGRCGKDVYWGYYEDTKTLIIAGEGEIDLGAWIRQPEYSAYPFEKAVVGEGVTGFKENAFTRCHYVKEITLPDSLEIIGNYTFFECKSLESIIIPANVNSIGIGVFAHCNSLEKVKVDKSNPVFDSRYSCNGIVRTDINTLICGCKNTKIPYSVTSIGAMAFGYCDELTAIRLHASVESVNNMAFESCAKLSKINVYNPNVRINDVMGSAIPSTATIYGYKGSTIQTYANNNKKIFKSLSGQYIPMGDVDNDSRMSVLDATSIQMYIAELKTLTTSETRCADMDGDWSVTVIDATAIQRILAELE
ncbi:MAG: hypothetical protein E7513_04725 [Ruminococcaceae bacterium]|nr:hypothetical protein [Oscillospiraceae bacterium]